MSKRKTLSDLVAGLSDGDFDAMATGELRKVTDAVAAGNGKGTVTITIGIQQDKRKLVMTPQIKVKVPVPATDRSMFYIDKDGVLSDEDPLQTTIKFDRPKSNLVQLDGGKTATVDDDNDGNEKKGN